MEEASGTGRKVFRDPFIVSRSHGGPPFLLLNLKERGSSVR